MKLSQEDVNEIIEVNMREDVDDEVLDDSNVDNVGEGFIRAAHEFEKVAFETIRRFGERRDWEWEPVANSIEVKPANYEGSRQGFGQMTVPIEINHPAASHWHTGTEDRVITPNNPAFALKIPWPEAPPGTSGVVWDDGTKHVLRSRAEPSGIDRIPFMDDGEKAAQRKLEDLFL